MNESQNQTIENIIELQILKGFTDLDDIYTYVVDRIKVPRPTVRRVAGEMRRKYEKYCKVLNANCETIPAS